ncbi:hypothetical protein [Bacillus sp. FJAT-27225]|uniref:hypothetical protein n=1 Tax=Bacillus sp. FJAT-27225 TaxID=1743144 RepID=UPI00158611A2|nr:hypothetical protein [Bacillus sp. FJAT-27225]
MKRFLAISVSYFCTGIGSYYFFSSHATFYSKMVLTVGFLGILFDGFYKKMRE